MGENIHGLHQPHTLNSMMLKRLKFQEIVKTKANGFEEEKNTFQKKRASFIAALFD